MAPRTRPLISYRCLLVLKRMLTTNPIWGGEGQGEGGGGGGEDGKEGVRGRGDGKERECAREKKRRRRRDHMPRGVWSRKEPGPGFLFSHIYII